MILIGYGIFLFLYSLVCFFQGSLLALGPLHPDLFFPLALWTLARPHYWGAFLFLCTGLWADVTLGHNSAQTALSYLCIYPLLIIARAFFNWRKWHSFLFMVFVGVFFAQLIELYYLQHAFLVRTPLSKAFSSALLSPLLWWSYRSLGLVWGMRPPSEGLRRNYG